MDQTGSQVAAPVIAGPQVTMLDAVAFFAIAVAVTLGGRAVARALFPGSHPSVQRAFVQAALLAGLALGAYVGLHVVGSGGSSGPVQLSAHKAQ